MRHGNGWLAVTASPEQLRERLAKLKRLAEAAGRRFEDLSLVYKLFLNIGEAKRSAFDAREPGTGSVTEITDDLKRLFDLGFPPSSCAIAAAAPPTSRAQIDRFVTEIVPRCSIPSPVALLQHERGEGRASGRPSGATPTLCRHGMHRPQH